MTFEKFTIKAQEAVQSAINIAQRNGQQTIEPVHILAGVMDKGKDVINYIFQKIGVNAQAVETAIQNEMSHLPKVSGGEPYQILLVSGSSHSEWQSGDAAYSRDLPEDG